MSSTNGRVLICETDEEFVRLKSANRDKLLVIDFFATWYVW